MYATTESIKAALRVASGLRSREMLAHIRATCPDVAAEMARRDAIIAHLQAALSEAERA